MSLNQAFNAAAMGIQASSFRVQVHTLNVANTNTPDYLRKIPLLSQNQRIPFQGVLSQMQEGLHPAVAHLKSTGVKIDGVVLDETPGKKLFAPGHPQADKNGYITLSNVNVINEIADSVTASRLYEANLAVVSLVKQMATRALEIGRGQ